MTTLAEARALALENLRTVKKGLDPRGGIPNFEKCAEAVIRLHSDGWKDGGKSAGQWRATLRDYAYPLLGNKRIDLITTGDILQVLSPIWHSKHETAKRLRQRIGAVSKWAIAQSYRQDDPAGATLSAALPKAKTIREHHKAPNYSELAAAIETVRGTGAHWATISCFELLALTATRSGECRLAEWPEFDLQAASWEIPALRTKTGRPHKVPLSDRALEILNDARERTGGQGWIFPSKTGRAMSDSTVSKLVREAGLTFVPHGLRTAFRMWTAERTTYPREVAEMALAHVNRDRVEAAYMRSDLYELRRSMMQSWSSFLSQKSAVVVKIA